jgi:hypothetical protein
MIEALLEDLKSSGSPIPKINASRLAELKAKELPRATPESIGMTFTPNDGCATGECDAAKASAAAYLSEFADPTIGCPNCGRQYSFEWGIQFGHGNCTHCSWPGVANHNIPGVGVVGNVRLWMHPAVLEMRDDAKGGAS